MHENKQQQSTTRSNSCNKFTTTFMKTIGEKHADDAFTIKKWPTTLTMDFLYVYQSKCNYNLQLHSGNMLNTPVFNKVLEECRLYTYTIQEHNSDDKIMEDTKGWDSSDIWQIHSHGTEPLNSINACIWLRKWWIRLSRILLQLSSSMKQKHTYPVCAYSYHIRQFSNHQVHTL